MAPKMLPTYAVFVLFPDSGKAIILYIKASDTIATIKNKIQLKDLNESRGHRNQGLEPRDFHETSARSPREAGEKPPEHAPAVSRQLLAGISPESRGSLAVQVPDLSALLIH